MTNYVPAFITRNELHHTSHLCFHLTSFLPSLSLSLSLSLFSCMYRSISKLRLSLSECVCVCVCVPKFQISKQPSFTKLGTKITLQTQSSAVVSNFLQ